MKAEAMFQKASKMFKPRSSGLIRDTIQKTKLVKRYKTKSIIHKTTENGWKTWPSWLALVSVVLTKMVKPEV